MGSEMCIRDSYTSKSSLESSCARRGALVRQVVARLNAGLPSPCCARGGFAQKEEEAARFRGRPSALASELCVWNGGVSPGELGTLLTTVESDRRRRICLSLLLSTRLSDIRSERRAPRVQWVVSGARYNPRAQGRGPRSTRCKTSEERLFSQVGRLTRPQLRADKRVVG